LGQFRGGQGHLIFVKLSWNLRGDGQDHNIGSS
jgi:hypothetical protein